MEVILKKNVDKLGYTNEVVTVKPGYGRNFLIPQGYAVLATASAKKAHEEIMRQKSHKESKMLAEAQVIAAKLAEVTLTIATKAGENGMELRAKVIEALNKNPSDRPDVRRVEFVGPQVGDDLVEAAIAAGRE